MPKYHGNDYLRADLQTFASLCKKSLQRWSRSFVRSKQRNDGLVTQSSNTRIIRTITYYSSSFYMFGEPTRAALWQCNVDPGHKSRRPAAVFGSARVQLIDA